VHALEINHNFDAHGGNIPATDAFCREIRARGIRTRRLRTSLPIPRSAQSVT
jgi:hypothetical protein